MRADIAETARPKKRIANAMAQHIAIRMPHGTLLEWHFNPADDELATLRKAMQVVTDAGSRHL
jgi:hypothetical protein